MGNSPTMHESTCEPEGTRELQFPKCSTDQGKAWLLRGSSNQGLPQYRVIVLFFLWSNLLPWNSDRLDREVPSEISNHARPEMLGWRRGAIVTVTHSQRMRIANHEIELEVAVKLSTYSE
jgi:hypothetical protein